MKIHKLKILEKHYIDIWNNDKVAKTAEIRFNDRDYQIGDLIYFEQILTNQGKPSNAKAIKTAPPFRIYDHVTVFKMLYITHILDDTTYLQPGYVMLSFTKINLIVKDREYTLQEYGDHRTVNHKDYIKSFKVVNKFLKERGFNDEIYY